MLDLIIRNGMIVNGTGLPAYRGDVGVAGGRLVSVGRSLEHASAARIIDAAGKVVSWWTGPERRRARPTSRCAMA